MPAAPAHIVIVLPSLGGGGAERVALTLARHWREREHRVTLLLLRREGALLNEASALAEITDLGGVRVLL